jgi:hypothetical protein
VRVGICIRLESSLTLDSAALPVGCLYIEREKEGERSLGGAIYREEKE